MKIQTFSILAGSEACNARCPFCISKMTPLQGITLKEPKVNWRNFRKACLLAKQQGVATTMITGKGEPTLFPDQITKYLNILQEFQFPFIELQTNGILLTELKKKYRPYLKEWYKKGLTTIAISIVHYNSEKNRQIYSPHKNQHINLPDLIKFLHKIGFTVRLAVILVKNYVDTSQKLERLIQFAKQNKVEQLTARPLNKPRDSENKKVEKWTSKHCLTKRQLTDIQDYLEKNGTKIMSLMHGAIIYDLKGQNFCLTTSLTLEANSEDIRQLIFFPDGHLRFDWQYKGAILL